MGGRGRNRPEVTSIFKWVSQLHESITQEILVGTRTHSSSGSHTSCHVMTQDTEMTAPYGLSSLPLPIPRSLLSSGFAEAVIPGRNVSGHTLEMGKTASWWWEAPSRSHRLQGESHGGGCFVCPLPKPQATKWIILEGRFQWGSESHPHTHL